MSDLRQRTIDIVKKKGLVHRDEAFTLSSGELSHYYMNGKRALAHGRDLQTACMAIDELAHREGVEWDAAGGLTLGADSFAHVLAVIAGKDWFVVRKEPKVHGERLPTEGADLGPGTRVLLVDDVISTGRSILLALEAVHATGAEVVLAVTLVDRGDVARAEFDRRGVRYAPLMTYADLEIPPVGGS